MFIYLVLFHFINDTLLITDHRSF